jgi:outer membrane protein assembly factor BamB
MKDCRRDAGQPQWNGTIVGLSSDMRSRTAFFISFLALCVVLCAPQSVRAIGWGSTDFLIFGAPNFPDRIGVFDQNFAFKGNLFTNWVGLTAMNFDRQGRLVAYNFFSNEVRLYDPSGTLVGGFNSTTSPMLTGSGDVQVMRDGNYVFGTQTGGARVFTPQGTFVRQYGSGNSSSICLLPGDRLWSGNPSTLTMNVFDTNTGDQVGSFQLDQQTRPSYMNFSASTNTVLVIDEDRDAGGVFERDLNGVLQGQFHIPVAQTGCNGATRGPQGHVFGTSDDFFVDVVNWNADGSVAGTLNVYPSQITAARILWAGSAPEPGTGALLLVGLSALNLLRPVRNR